MTNPLNKAAKQMGTYLFWQLSDNDIKFRLPQNWRLEKNKASNDCHSGTLYANNVEIAHISEDYHSKKIKIFSPVKDSTLQEEIAKRLLLLDKAGNDAFKARRKADSKKSNLESQQKTTAAEEAIRATLNA